MNDVDVMVREVGLRDGLQRSARVPELEPIVRDRLRLVVGDARSVLQSLPVGDAPDVVVECSGQEAGIAFALESA